jgi:hypothetical protein
MTARHYATPLALKQALEQRLKSASATGVDLLGAASCSSSIASSLAWPTSLATLSLSRVGSSSNFASPGRGPPKISTFA